MSTDENNQEEMFRRIVREELKKFLTSLYGETEWRRKSTSIAYDKDFHRQLGDIALQQYDLLPHAWDCDLRIRNMVDRKCTCGLQVTLVSCPECHDQVSEGKLEEHLKQCPRLVDVVVDKEAFPVFKGLRGQVVEFLSPISINESYQWKVRLAKTGRMIDIFDYMKLRLKEEE